MNKGLIVGVVLLALVVGVFLVPERGVTSNVSSVDGRAYVCNDGDGDLSFDEAIFIADKVETVRKGNGDTREKFDLCVNDGESVKEYYCSTDARIFPRTIHCKNGCRDGACVPDFGQVVKEPSRGE